MALDKYKYLLKNLSRIPLWEGDSLLKSYMRGDFVLHCHFAWKSRASHNPATEYYCAVYKRAFIENLDAIESESSVPHYVYNPDRGTDEVQPTVLVDVREFMENPKWMEMYVCPSVVRLQALDDCLSLWTDPPDLVKPSPSLGNPFAVDITELTLTCEDGKFGMLQVVTKTYMGQGKLVGEMIKGRAGLIDDFPPDDAQSGRGIAIDVNGGNQVILSPPFRVEIGVESVRASFDKSEDFFIESFQVLACSRELESDSVYCCHA